jgi:NADPH:quinone reductase-like Zn-dependent oxidoreductase
MAWDFVVAKGDLRRTEFRDVEPPPLEDGQVRLAIESFALTANNITYAVFGEMMRYWDFFPGPDGFGRVPVWGHARVEASAHPDIAVGQRFYGYWPMSTHLTVQAKPGRAGFTDVAPHRQPLPPIYNQYLAVGAENELEAHRALLQPLFITAFLIDDQFDEHGVYGAASVILSSASSKTAIGLAALLKKRGGVKVVGLTSPRNKAFVEGLGFYDQVVLYDDLATAPIEGPAAFVDFAGDAAVLAGVHNRFADELKASILVGGTHWEAPKNKNGGGGGTLPGPTPAFFFAPDRVAKRQKDWAPGEFEQRYGAAWTGFVADAPQWLTVETGEGREAMQAAYLTQVDGGTPADVGVVLRP